MKIKKTHMIFLLLLIGAVCIIGGNTVEGMDHKNLIGGNPSTWGPPLEKEHERKAMGKDPATWGPPLKKHGRKGKETPAEQMMKIFFISFLLLFIVFLFF
jgi:hypothetical protein